ncbi:cysteine desulfurase family protein [Roseofilum casamattae]|uniref:Cysteine desulfurase family protein n=1 Tax=Roseofilum casamattae BLCC-M143 TaxID=3022442 RepID=A0ABT7BWB6_9CYAN|nr:cysteine desulfurase family protein [Roseofilum casamattae]MDJ1182809.1 cysteine desulfurase family protein [Roseofilum casamattae BLCC-M143]
MNSYPIYLDYHATTPVDRRIADRILEILTVTFGNPSSIDHCYGDEAAAAVKAARQQVARLVNAAPKEIVFTSGATESINIAIQGHFPQCTGLPPARLIVSPVEHKAVLDTCQALEKDGLAEIKWLNVDRQARIDLEHLEHLCSQGAALLCLMAANNEVGNIYPLETIGKIVKKHAVPWFCDGSQAVGKIPINFSDSGMIYLAISGHKLYAPKGIGALLIRKPYSPYPLFYGGAQERELRPGTLNTPGIVGLGEACALRDKEMERDEREIAQKRDRLQSLLAEQIPNLVINGDPNNRLAGNLHISIPDIPNSAIIARVRKQLAISTGAACSSGTPAPSHVLRAMQLRAPEIDGALRISLGKFTTQTDIDRAASLLINAVIQINQIA